MEAVLEGLLFVSGKDGLSLKKISELLEIDSDKALDLIYKLDCNYNDESRGLRIEKLGDNYKLVTKKEHSKYYEKLMQDVTSEHLSNQALETLAIIAYNQPITRGKIDEMRGVDSSYQIRRLLLKELIEEAGRSEGPGRPMLYKTTDSFLDYFGLSTLKDLPEVILDETFEEEKELFLKWKFFLIK